MEVSETGGYVFTIQPSDIMSNEKPSTGMGKVVMCDGWEQVTL